MKIFKKILILLGFLTGFLILMYPTFSDLWNRYRSSQLINTYEAQIEEVKTEDKTIISRMLSEARAYNAEHTTNTVADAFGENSDYTITHPYDDLLNLDGDGIMGAVEIPKISIELAIYHGTGTDVLEKGAGHVKGTSLPCGGENTHAVLAAHRGLPNAKLFTDLDQIVAGDKFFLHILGETLAYEVDQIKVVEPDDMTYLAIDKGQDLVTLLTCTPYGVNTQRLLVRGHRIPYVEEDVKTEEDKQTIHMERDEPVRYLAAGLTAVFIIISILRAVISRHSKKVSRKDQ